MPELAVRDRQLRRIPLVLAAGLALWAALALLDILPFTLNLSDWTYWRFFGVDWFGGVLWASQAMLWWGAALFAREGRWSPPQVRLIAAAHAALAVVSLVGGTAAPALLPGALAAFGAAILSREMARPG